MYFPGIDPLVVRKNDKVRIRFGNFIPDYMAMNERGMSDMAEMKTVT